MFAAKFDVCLSCLALEQAQFEQAKKDQETAKGGGFVAVMSRLWHVAVDTHAAAAEADLATRRERYKAQRKAARKAAREHDN